MKVEVAEDGVREFHCSQTWLNTFKKCPEQARLKMLGLLEDGPSDATAIGHGLHGGIESVLLGDGRDPFEVAHDLFLQEVGNPDFRWVQVKTEATAFRYIDSCLASWLEHVYPQLPDVASVEQSFKLTLDERCRPRHTLDVDRLVITGTWDLLDAEGELHDWKTANQPYDDWKTRRYYVQPTFYCYAARELGGASGDTQMFNYWVMPKSSTPRRPQHIPVQRSEQHYTWLKKQLWSIVDLWYDTDEGQRPWPMMDTDWWCSPKWCPAYESCRGIAF